METEFITAVQACRALYDKSKKNYSNKIFVNKKWGDIGKEFGFAGPAACKKWSRLRDYFQRNRKQATTFKSGAAGKSLKKWYLYDAMTFLVPFMADRPTTSNFPEHSENSSDDDMSQGKSPQAMSTISDNTEDADLESQVSFSGTSRTPTGLRGRKRPSPFPQERQSTPTSSQFDIEMVKAIQNLGSKCSSADSLTKIKNTFDEDEHYSLSLVQKMKMLEPIEKMQCQMEIHGVIVKYPLKHQSQPGPSQLCPSQSGTNQPGPSQPGSNQPGPSQPGPSQPGPSQQRPTEQDRQYRYHQFQTFDYDDSYEYYTQQS